jgi:Uncharacterized conserved protein (COG2071)
LPRLRSSALRLERALLLGLVTHAAAMLGMVALLLPSMPGGGAADAARIAHIAAHPWLFRLGWLPWHVTALGDLYLAVALVRTPWVPRAPAVATLLLTLAALVPDQGSQILWITRGVALAQEAVQSGDPGPYLAFEAPLFQAAAGWAGTLYTLAGIGWTACLWPATRGRRAYAALSAVTWSSFAVFSAMPLLPPALRLPPAAVAAGNAVDFMLLLVWMAVAAELVLRRARPVTASGLHAPWRHPSPGLAGRLVSTIAESRLARALCRPLPVVSFASDITDVVYANYLVPAERLLPLVPAGLELQRLGPGGRFALFTFLTYQHGHFGPLRLGPLRRVFPSPVHTNWRIHVVDPRTGRRGVHFVTNAIANVVQALGARLMSEGMPMHLLARGEITRSAAGGIHITLDPGAGTAPDAEMDLLPGGPVEALGAPWNACFASYRELLAYAVPQDRAMATQPWQGTVSRQEIDLGIPLDACEPLAGEVRSRAARAIAGEAMPLCFRVARVSFLFTGEELDALPDPEEG